MYVCLCNAITDREFCAHAVDEGCTVSAVYRSLGSRNAVDVFPMFENCCGGWSRPRTRTPLSRQLDQRLADLAAV